MRRIRDYGAVADICRAARIREGFKQTELAAMVGISPAMISLFENGRNDDCMIFLSYAMFLNEEDKKLIMEEVYSQNDYVIRRSKDGGGGNRSTDE